MQLAYPSHVLLANITISLENSYLDLSEGAKRLTPMLLQAFAFGGHYAEGDHALRSIHSKT